MDNINKQTKIFLLLLLTVAILIRIDFHSWQKVMIMSDTGSYLRCVDKILMNGQILDHFRTPVYPLFLTGNFVLFGYREFVPVVIVQSLLGIASIFLVYIISLRLTHNYIVSLIAGIVHTFNLHFMHYETFIVTESLASFLVLFTVYLFLVTLNNRFGLLSTIVLSLSFLTLIFLRPIFLVTLLIPLTISVVYYFKEKDKKGFLNLLVSVVIIVFVPILLWCYAIKQSYGFFSLSNVAQVNVFGVALQRDMLKYAPEQYKEFVEVIKQERQNLSGKDRYNPHIFLKKLNGIIPKKSDADYSYLLKFSIASIQRAPFVFLKNTVSMLPVVFSKIEKMRDYGKRGTFVSLIAFKVYKYTMYKFCKEKVWILFILFSIFYPVVLYRKDFYQWMAILVIIMFIWLHIFAVVFLSYSDYDRLRMPVDSLIIIILCFGVYRLISILRSRKLDKVKP